MALNKSKKQSLVHTLSEIVFLFFSFGTCQTSCSSIGNFPISSLLSVFKKLWKKTIEIRVEFIKRKRFFRRVYKIIIFFFYDIRIFFPVVTEFPLTDSISDFLGALSFEVSVRSSVSSLWSFSVCFSACWSKILSSLLAVTSDERFCCKVFW